MGLVYKITQDFYHQPECPCLGPIRVLGSGVRRALCFMQRGMAASHLLWLNTYIYIYTYMLTSPPRTNLKQTFWFASDISRAVQPKHSKKSKLHTPSPNSKNSKKVRKFQRIQPMSRSFRMRSVVFWNLWNLCNFPNFWNVWNFWNSDMVCLV